MTAALTPARLGAALAERYRLERELGQGGMATVHVAHNLKHDREVAIKVLRPELSQSITGERFLREIAITARLNHPHIGFLSLYDYDRTPLNAKVESRDTTPVDWIREDVTFDAPAGGGRMAAVLFLPKRVKAPYQTIVMWPASDAFILHDKHELSLWFVDYLLRGGRAVLYPIYEHTYGRGTPMAEDVPNASITHRDQMLQWAKEMRRAIDYAVTRADIDSARLAYAGTSWGGRLGGVMMAIEPRFKAGVLNVAGLKMLTVRPEEDAVNFLPRTELVAESLKWLDHYLGPVRQR